MNKFKCPFCNRIYVAKIGLYNHMENEHYDELCGLPAAQVAFNYRNKYKLTKGNGKSVVYGLPTKWNPVTERYERFANDDEKKAFREMCLQRMIKVYGKESLMNDPEHQKKMLANRSISGNFEWPNGEVSSYTGSFERAFLEHLSDCYEWANAKDVISPAPMIIDYKYNNTAKIHIPDFYISSLNLIINIKSKNNKGYRLAQIDREIAEDMAIKNTTYNYIKIYDNDFREFDKLMRKFKENGVDLSKPVHLI